MKSTQELTNNISRLITINELEVIHFTEDFTKLDDLFQKINKSLTENCSSFDKNYFDKYFKNEKLSIKVPLYLYVYMRLQ